MLTRTLKNMRLFKPAQLLPRNNRKKLFVYRNAAENPETQKYDPWDDFKKMSEPYLGHRPHGISALRLIAETGVTTVAPYEQPSSKKIRDAIAFLCGTCVVFVGDTLRQPPSFQTLPGLALHPGNAAKTAQFFRGDVNPHLGYGFLHAKLDKWEEFLLAEKVSPGLMPPLYRLSDLPFY